MLTATEYNVISSIPIEKASAVIANPTVPLPLSRDDRARLSILLYLKILAPKYPPTVLVAIAAGTIIIRYGIKLAKDGPLNFMPIIAKNRGAKKPKVIPETIPYAWSALFFPNSFSLKISYNSS
jgi:hypothetical protein